MNSGPQVTPSAPDLWVTDTSSGCWQPSVGERLTVHSLTCSSLGLLRAHPPSQEGSENLASLVGPPHQSAPPRHSQPSPGLSSEVGTLALGFGAARSQSALGCRAQRPAHLREGFEGGGPTQLLPALGHRLGRLLGSLGCFFHTLLDFPAKVTFTDFIETLLRQKGSGVNAVPLGGPQELPWN